MVDFRRWITAIAVLALFAGLACAQVNSSSAGTGSLQCAATVAAPPALRAEGMTELIDKGRPLFNEPYLIATQ